MARRRRRKHRRYGSVVALPLGRLGALLPSTSSDVAPLDVVAGGGSAFVVSNLAEAFLGTQSFWQQIKGTLGSVFPLLVGGATGGIAMALKGQLGTKRAEGIFWGAVSYGAAATLKNLLAGVQIPGTSAVFSDVVALPLGGGYAGLLVNNPVPQQAMGGLLVNNPVPQQSNLAALGHLSMSDDYDGMDALAAMG